MSLFNERSRFARSVFLSVMSICGSVAAAVWLLTSDVAMAEVKQTAEETKKAVLTKINGSAEQKQDTAKKPQPKAKKKKIDFGSFEGY